MDSKPPAESFSHSVVCPQCRNLIGYLDYPRSSYFGCGECGSYFTRLADGVSQLIRRFDPDNKITPDFRFGTEFKGATLVGLVYKRDPKEEFYWTEYLFAQKGTDYYVTLADVDGYWMVVTRDSDQRQYTDGGTGQLIYQKPLMSYQFELVYAVGEFNWDISGDEQLLTTEYLIGEYVIINEAGGVQTDWYKGVFIGPKDLCRQLFVPLEQLSPRKFFNPKTFYPRWQALMPFSAFLIGFLVLLSIVMAITHRSKVVFKDTFPSRPDTSAWFSGGVSAAAQITPAFHIDGLGRIDINASCASLDNSWLELAFSLVNNQTGREYDADKTLEYYHGVDDGEQWTEGNNHDQVSFSGVPPGDYHLNIFPTLAQDTMKAMTGSSDTNYTVSVVEFGSLLGNFFSTFLLLLAYPLAQFLRKKIYENSARNTKIYGTVAGSK